MMAGALRATAALAGVVAVAACGPAGDAGGGQEAADSSGLLAVVATTTQVADFARNIGGDKVSVTQILKPNVDAHDYEPTPADIQAISRAKVVVRNGVGLETWLDRTVQAAGSHGTVVDTSQGVAVREGDPHIWHNPRNAQIMVRNITQAFAAANPAGAATYQKNLQDYAARLDRLDADIARKVDSLPADRRKLVTNHDAFGYYIDRYRLEFIGSIIPGADTSTELSGKDIDDLVRKIKATGTRAVFSESSLPPRTADAIARQAGVAVVAGEDALYGDALGPAGSPGATYLQSEQHNTDVIVAALRG